MDQNEMCRLIAARHQKLRSLREQAANDNQSIKRLFMGAIKHLLSDESTQQSAYQEISQLVITASPILAKSLAEEIISRLKSAAAGLEQHLIFWGRAYDGSTDKKKYPNFKGLLQNIRIKNEERPLSAKFRGYYQEFQKNFNQLNDQRVEFFQDFDDDVLSDSMDNDSKIEEIIYLNIMELKMARNKLEKEKLTEEALLEQINKIRHFITLRPPSVLTDLEKNEYEKELKWAKNYLAGKEEEMRQNPSLSINQTFNLSLDEENIEIINKKDFQQRRKLNNEPKKSREVFTDSIDFRDELNRESKAGNKVGSSSKLQAYISPIKQISDPKYNPNLGESMDSDISIRNDDKKKLEIAKLKSEFQENADEEELEDLVVHKYKTKPQEVNFSKQKEQEKPRDFSVTENYFNKEGKSRTANEFASPKSPQHFKSQTMKSWKKSEYMSPSRNSRCKLSQFTSNKKQRKQLVPRQQITLPQEYAINPYLAHFQTLPQLTKFRRDCFEHSFTIFACPQLLISCNVFKQVNTEIRIQILFTNNTNFPLEIQNVYKVPKCYRIQKKCKISKRFSLHTNMKHVFVLDVEEFPLQACLINLKFRSMASPDNVQVILPLPITIINFVEYLHTSEDEWIEEWKRLSNRQNRKLFMLTRHLQVDRQVVREQFDWILREYFIHAGSVQGYSVQDFGSCCYYSALNGLKFLLRLSVRVDNIISLQAVSCRPVNDNEQDFIKYVLNIWMMLLSRLYF